LKSGTPTVVRMAERSSISDDYVTQARWVHPAGRRDLVDEIADQFERPTQPAAVADRPEENTVRWPRRSRGWRYEDRLHPGVFERRAAG
jgi:hypothetical protein